MMSFSKKVHNPLFFCFYTYQDEFFDRPTDETLNICVCIYKNIYMYIYDLISNNDIFKLLQVIISNIRRIG
jgi:hypothetical protein